MDNIKIICILPRSRKYCRYVINDGEVHSKKYEDLRKFLISLAPTLAFEITRKIQTFSYFLLLVEEQQIIDLAVDIRDRVDQIKKTFKNFNIEKVYKFMQKSKKSDPLDKIKRSNDIIDRISNLGR